MANDLNNRTCAAHWLQPCGRGGCFDLCCNELPLIVLSLLVIISMAFAAIYGMQNGSVDIDAICGKVEFRCDEAALWSIEVDQDKYAIVRSSWGVARGRLRVDGVDSDSVLFVLTDPQFEGGLNSEGAVVMIRVPKTGLNGGLVGPWMIYASFPDDGECPGRSISSWVILQPGGAALKGERLGFNAMVVKQSLLEPQSERLSWACVDGSVDLSTSF